MRPFPFLLVISVFREASCGPSSSIFDEVLRVATLSRSRALVSFEFTHEVALRDSQWPAHYFPLEWLSLLENGVATVGVSLTRGLLPADAAAAATGGAASLTDAPSGSLFDVVFDNDFSGARGGGTTPKRAAWDDVVSRVAAITCGAVAGSGVVPPAPALGGAPSAGGVAREWYVARMSSRATLALPHATLCSDVLWNAVRVTPCRAHAGLGAALAPRFVLDGEWYGVSWFAARSCVPPSGACTATLRVTVASVATLSPNASIKDMLNVSDWGEVDGRDAACALSSTSALILHRAVKTALHLPLNPDTVGTPLHLLLNTEENSHRQSFSDGVEGGVAIESLRACIIGSRSLSAPFFGGVAATISITNVCRESQAPGSLRFTEVLPWMLSRVPDSTIASVDDGAWVPLTVSDLASATHRGSPAVTTFCVPLPSPGKSILISTRFVADVGLVHAEESPPDVHRGFEMPPVRAVACATTCGAPCGAVAREWWLPAPTGGFVELPSVDFSMPYNVMVLIPVVAAFSLAAFINAIARMRGPQREVGGVGTEKEKEA